jgi:hypothetical protein
VSRPITHILAGAPVTFCPAPVKLLGLCGYNPGSAVRWIFVNPAEGPEAGLFAVGPGDNFAIETYAMELGTLVIGLSDDAAAFEQSSDTLYVTAFVAPN